MTFLEVVQSDWFCTCLCLVICLFHLVYEFVHGKKLGNKITALCSHCGLPIYDEVDKNFELTAEQIQSLTQFVLSLKKGGK